MFYIPTVVFPLKLEISKIYLFSRPTKNFLFQVNCDFYNEYVFMNTTEIICGENELFFLVKVTFIN